MLKTNRYLSEPEEYFCTRRFSWVFFNGKRTQPKKKVIYSILFSAITLLVVFAYLFQFAQNTFAAATSTINFQARLESSDGAIVPDGDYNVEFTLYSGCTNEPTSNAGCTLLWTEDYLNSASQGVVVSNGYLTVNLGSINPFSSASIPWSQPLYLGINIGGTGSSVQPTNISSSGWDGVMDPMLLLTAVPYAFQSEYATALQQSNTAGTDTSTLSFATPTANNTITIPNASGTVCLSSTSSSTCSPASGSGYYIQSGSTAASPQIANFAIQESSSYSGATEVLEDYSGQTTNDLLDFDNSSGGILSGFNSSGQLYYVGGSGNTGTIEQNTLSGSVVYDLPAATGTQTFCLENSSACGFATTNNSGNGNYIENQSLSPQSANFYISGTGEAATSILTPSIDTISSGTLSIGTNTVTTAVTLGRTGGTTTINGNSSSSINFGNFSVSAAGAGTFSATSDAVLLNGSLSASTSSSLLAVGSNISGGSANGTYIGVNAASGFGGNLITLQKNGTSEFSVSNSGTVSANSYYIASNNINTAGTLSNVAYLSATSQTFAGANTFSGLITLGGGLAPDITTATASTASTIGIQPGISSAASGTGATLTLQGGNQSGSTTTIGGTLSLLGGNATGSGGSNTGGNVNLDAGTGATANGAINIGTTNSATTTLGRSGGTTVINGNSSSTINFNSGGFSVSSSGGTYGLVASGAIQGASFTNNSVTTSATFQVNTSGNLTLGSSSATGELILNNGSSNGVTLQEAASPGHAYTVNIPYSPGTGLNYIDTVCLAVLANCSGASGGSGDTNYIENQYSSTETGNFNIKSASSSAVVAVLEGATSQSADLLDIENSTPSIVFGVGNTGNITATGTYNTNTFTSSALTFGASSAATVQAAASQALTVSAGSGNSVLTLNSTGSGAITLDSTGTGTVNVGTGSSNKTIDVGTNTSATDTIYIGSTSSTTNIKGSIYSAIALGTGTSTVFSVAATTGVTTLQGGNAIDLTTPSISSNANTPNSITIEPGINNYCANNAPSGTCSLTGAALDLYSGDATGWYYYCSERVGVTCEAYASGTSKPGNVNIDTGTSSSGSYNQYGYDQGGTINIGPNYASAINIGDSTNLGNTLTEAGESITLTSSLDSINEDSTGSSVNIYGVNGVLVGSTSSQYVTITSASTSVSETSNVATFNINPTSSGTLNLGTSITSSSGAINVGSDSSSTASAKINIGGNTGASSAATITIGATQGADTLDLNGGSGGVSILSSSSGTITIGSTSAGTVTINSNGNLTLNGDVGINATATTGFLIDNPFPLDATIIIKDAGSQSGSSLQVQNSSGTVETSIGAGGYFYGPALDSVSLGNSLLIGTSNASTLTIGSTTESTTTLNGDTSVSIQDASGGTISVGTTNTSNTIKLGDSGSTGYLTLTTSAATLTAPSAGTVTLDSTAAGSVVVGTNATTITLGSSTSTAYSINIGSSSTSAVVDTIKIGSIESSSQDILQGGVITTTTGQGGIVIGSTSSTNTSLVPLYLDSDDTFAETTNTCTSSVNNGALYYNSNTNTVRGCVNGSWQDIVSTQDFALQLFGVVPNSGSNPGDLIGASATSANESNTGGPCKVNYDTTAGKVYVNSCLAYSGGRLVSVSAQSVSISSLTAGYYTDLCLNSSGTPALLSSAGASTMAGATFNNLTTTNATTMGQPLLCLAMIKGGGSTGTVGAIYDARTFTTTTKTYATDTTSSDAFLGAVVSPSSGDLVASANSATGIVQGVVVAYTGSAASGAGAPNVILAVAGPQWVVASSGTADDFVVPSTTSGVATGATTSGADAYDMLGVNLSTYATSCSAQTYGLTDCNASDFVYLNIQ